MRITLRCLGLTLLDVEVNEDADADADADEYDEPGSCTTTPIGFTATPGDQRWETGADYGYSDDE